MRLTACWRKPRADIAGIIKGLRQGSNQQRSVIDDEARKAREALKEVSERALSIEEELPGKDLATGYTDSLRPLEPRRGAGRRWRFSWASLRQAGK